MTDTQIVNAIQARIDGRFNDPDLMLVGALHDRMGDIVEILSMREHVNPEHHTCEEDKESGLCRICRVEMTAECEDCQGIGYHMPTCPQMVTP
jgi:hypothetical protein